MNYLTGEKILVGDYVKLWDGNHGTVVCSVDDDQYSSEYSKAEWEYLAEGVLIKSDKAGLVHQTKANEDMELVKRAKN